MVDRSEKPNPNPKSTFTNQNHRETKKEEGKKVKKKSDFEFCKVCKLNHNQGARHKYFPNHKSALSAFLYRFENKINDVRFFLKNPTVLRPEHADRNRFWCVFCDTDVDEHNSSFACENAINHMADAHHLKNLKHFLWLYGGKMEQLDKYRILETDLTKWEKKCESLKDEATAAPIEGSCGVVYGASNDIHNNVNFKKTNNCGQNTLNSLKPSYSNAVLPLLYNTNEYQISNSSFPEVANFGSSFNETNFSLNAGGHSNASLLISDDLTANNSSQQNLLYNSGTCSGNAYVSNVGVCQVYQRAGMVNEERSSQGSQILTQVSSISTIDAAGNVHSGAPPPWFEATDQTLLNNQAKPALSSFMSSNKSWKSRKLNPKRVGAAWAEKRKMELEKEKRGEIVESDCDANWLPNFGRVWQSGSRKESRKRI
ncbi:Coiled-coil domain-containing protein 84 [Hibiscus syriacus]|uniref:Coiled-coil domain-containing protein 84 n=1 Tax=Hibiscus syriacus TaxID=106335 RepID=A0A6A2X869_HIBSY|nr:TITAN-like protein [Hibiscus syriacus]KAE8663375.1 Coiled-coil domain-containing protein 84 [Hibiscus syriacus]